MVRKHVVDEVVRWWRTAPQEARGLLMRRIVEEPEAAKTITLEELTLGIVAAETDTGEIERQA